jgi:hypothetical protein
VRVQNFPKAVLYTNSMRRIKRTRLHKSRILIVQCTRMHLKERMYPYLVTSLDNSILGAEATSADTSNRQKTTESVTLRFHKHVLDRLRKDAEDKQISLNTLLNQIAIQHLDWHAHAAKAGFITVRKGNITKMLEKIPEKDIIEIAELTARKESKEFVMMLRNEYSLISALDVIETWIEITGYSYRHEVRGSEHFFIVQHDMGKKWSLFLKEMYRFIFEDFGLTRVDFDSSENTLSFKVDIGAIFMR